MLEASVNAARELGVNVRVGNVLSSDIFYYSKESPLPMWGKMGVLATEMEAAALYMNAAEAGKKALCITTVSDCPLRGESTTSEERQNSFLQMMEIALKTAYFFENK